MIMVMQFKHSMSRSWMRIFLLCCLRLPGFFARSTLTTQVHHCPPSWTLFNHSCYFFNHDARVSWMDAQTECERRGSNLTSIHSQDEQDFLKGHILRIVGHYAIGLSDMENEGDFKWNDGTEIDFTAWYDYEPNDYKNNEDCAGLWLYNHQEVYRGGYWNDYNCYGGNPYICREQTDLNVFACEHQTLHITCDYGVIQVKYANYGRLDRETCWNNGNDNHNNCFDEDSFEIVGDICNGEETCEISASNNVFGDPCQGTRKYLEVRYSCDETTPLTTMKMTSAEITTDGSDIMKSATSMANTGNITTDESDRFVSGRSSVVAPVVSTLTLIMFAAGIIIGILLYRWRKEHRPSTIRSSHGNEESATHEIPQRNLVKQDSNDNVDYINNNVTSVIKDIVDEGQYADIENVDLPNKHRNDSVIEIYATSEYGGSKSDSDAVYANPDVISEPSINDDYSYATSDTFPGTKVKGQIEEAAEEEGWKDNEIYASDSDVEGWEDNTIYVESDKGFAGKG